ncbi:metallophosphoesterase family protein [Arthrobacter burdickii]|uniref:Metallophosphoesterase n=1 Tax=Arthrobacter burdickii TaxID=3035920 RepID=A0ABT8K2R0_9MICC|nr:metallophosphoesterase [Arthrobacter burdickii]MDN4611362.1 metallophosphoesterase [Arthrobacter burdickii]
MAHRRAALVLGLVLTCAALVLVVLYPPAFAASFFSRERLAAGAGGPVPPLDEPPIVRLAIAGDTGTGDAAEHVTADRMAAESREDPYDALVLLGDLIYEDGEAELTETVVSEPFAPIIDRGADLLPVLGNHDYDSGEQRQILERLGHQGPWYTEQVGPLRIIVLDSTRVEDEEQTRWLRATLAEVQPPGSWTVVAMHHPAYSAGRHGSNRAVRDAWSPLFAAAGVPLVLAGHDHDYQRSTPQDGVTYVVSGAGAKVRPTGSRDFTAVSSSTLHYVDLLVYEERLVGRAIDQSGRLVDSFTIDR